MAVVIETTVGDLTVDLFLKERPQACLNFLKLCKLKYYNYNLFHTIEHGFIAQTGDPTGVGDGGHSVWGVIEGQHKRFYKGESLPKIRHSEPGLLSMVSLGDNLIGSQFFFTLGSDLTSLDGIHCVIGQVTEGHDVLRSLNNAICDNTHKPYQDIRITHTVILEDPFDNPRGFREPSRSPSPSAERLRCGRIGADENIDDTAGKTEQEVHEMLQEREAKARATILEIVGDLPDAEVAPPENVLFVCKLNPVTNDDDLEIIFSRFGKVKGCEVIRDRVAGDSLQYAFVEFEDCKSCESAYFKMDNVLIDDRRIHVDFSQSVAKVQWKGKGRGLIYKDGHNSNKLNFNNLKKRGETQNTVSKEQRFGRQQNRQRSRSPVNNRKNEEKEMGRSVQKHTSKSDVRHRSIEKSKSRSPQRHHTTNYSRRTNYHENRRSRSAELRRNNDNRSPSRSYANTSKIQNQQRSRSGSYSKKDFQFEHENRNDRKIHERRRSRSYERKYNDEKKKYDNTSKHDNYSRHRSRSSSRNKTYISKINKTARSRSREDNLRCGKSLDNRRQSWDSADKSNRSTYNQKLASYPSDRSNGNKRRAKSGTPETRDERKYKTQPSTSKYQTSSSDGINRKRKNSSRNETSDSSDDLKRKHKKRTKKKTKKRSKKSKKSKKTSSTDSSTSSS